MVLLECSGADVLHCKASLTGADGVAGMFRCRRATLRSKLNRRRWCCWNVQVQTCYIAKQAKQAQMVLLECSGADVLHCEAS